MAASCLPESGMPKSLFLSDSSTSRLLTLPRPRSGPEDDTEASRTRWGSCHRRYLSVYTLRKGGNRSDVACSCVPIDNTEPDLLPRDCVWIVVVIRGCGGRDTLNLCGTKAQHAPPQPGIIALHAAASNGRPLGEHSYLYCLSLRRRGSFARLNY